MPTIGFVGIDNAGKTTIIDVFTKQKMTKTIPTVGVNLEQVTFSEIDFHLNILDMGGQKSFRLLWVDYLNTVDIVLYVIDASDHERLDEALKEFQNMLILTEANDIPILVLGSSFGGPGAVIIPGTPSQLQVRLYFFLLIFRVCALTSTSIIVESSVSDNSSKGNPQQGQIFFSSSKLIPPKKNNKS